MYNKGPLDHTFNNLGTTMPNIYSLGLDVLDKKIFHISFSIYCQDNQSSSNNVMTYLKM
jgi:hypothetical protein